MITELKPCPFCGGEAKYTYTTYKEPEEYAVVCEKCRILIKHYGTDSDGKRTDLCYKSKEEAAEAWNRRVADEREVSHET